MKAPIAKVVRSAFEKELLSMWPFFQRSVDQPLAPVCRLYKWTGDGASFFVMLQVDRRDDAFTIEVGWSLDGLWPPPFFVRAPVPEGAQAYRGLRFRLARLWEATDMWWQAKDVTSARSAVNEAVGRLRADGGPYLRDVASRLGVSFGPSEIGSAPSG
jgi:hypothetical protein